MDLVNWASIRFERGYENRGDTICSSKYSFNPSNTQQISLADKIIAFIRDFFSIKNQVTQAPRISSSSSHSSESSAVTNQIFRDAQTSLGNTTPLSAKSDFAKEMFTNHTRLLKNNQLPSGSGRANFFVNVDDLFKTTERENQHEIDPKEQFLIDRDRIPNKIFGNEVSNEEAIKKVRGELKKLFPSQDVETLFKRTLKILSQHSLNLIPILWGFKDSVKGDTKSATMRLDSEKKMIEIKANYTISKLDSEGVPVPHSRLGVIMYIPLDPNQNGQFIINRSAYNPAA